MSWIMWALLSAAGTALTAILTKVGVKNTDSSLVLAIESTVIVIATWCIVAYKGHATELLDIPGKAWPFILGAGLVTTGAYFCYFRALSLADASRVAPIDRLSLVFTVVLGMFLLREKVTPLAIAGVALMAVGALLVAVAPQK